MAVKKEVSRSWFVIFNNPQDHGYAGTPQEICDKLRAEWCITDTRRGAWAYCIKHYCGNYPVCTEDGSYLRHELAITEEQKAKIEPDLHHIHMVLEDEKPMRFSQIKNTYAIGAHFESTAGKKRQAEDYISKTGEYSEDVNRKLNMPWEEIIYVCRKGEIQGRQGQRGDINAIGAFIQAGLRPNEILDKQFSYYRHEREIRRAYFHKRDKEVPEEREVKVIWHTGASGSGKSYGRFSIMEEKGKENVYYLTDFEHGFDNYCGEPILWMEDFKGELKFGFLLRLLDKYKCELPCRYTNAKALFEEVHITSIYVPKQVYKRMVSESDQGTDLVEQLLRRITVMRFHFKTPMGVYASLDFPPTVTWEEMREASQMYIKNTEGVEAFQQAVFQVWDGVEDLPF